MMMPSATGEKDACERRQEPYDEHEAGEDLRRLDELEDAGVP